MDLVRDSALGIEFEIDPRFARVDPVRPWETETQEEPGLLAPPGLADELPTAHFIASEPAAGWIAALAIVTVSVEPLPAGEWLDRQLARARASFAEWSPASHTMLVPPVPAELGGRPALHVRYELTGVEPEGLLLGAAEPAPPSLVEHWTVLVEERAWLLAFELLVQPPARWTLDQAALTLPFRTLALV